MLNSRSGTMGKLVTQIKRFELVSMLMLVVGILAGIICLLPGLAVLVLVVAIWKSRSAMATTSDAYGSARWAGATDLMQAGCLDHDQGLTLGRVSLDHGSPFWKMVFATLFYPWSRSDEVMLLANSRSSVQQA
ncbi:MAG: hypothetical protein KDB27_20515, partial [Planctomycetales bacterium]|nr:hypothetical protein [Planctomycetales bacterium]